LLVESDSVDKGTEVEKVANQMVYFHRLGTDQSEDVLIYSDPNNPEWMFGVEVSDCGNYLLISVSESCEPVNRVYYSDITTLLEKKEAEKAQAFVKVIDNFEAEYSYITNESKRFWFKTNRNAPNYKIICLDLDNPNPDYFRDIIPASHKSLMNHAICVDSDKLIVSYLEDVKESLRIYSLEGEFVKSALDPSILTVTGLSGKKSQSELFFSVSSFTTPGTIYQMDLKNKEISKNVFLQIKIDGLNSEDYVEKQAFYESRDGTKVPMFIVHRKGITLNGANPTLLCKCLLIFNSCDVKRV
jgi:prolyl oligopeptidase